MHYLNPHGWSSPKRRTRKCETCGGDLIEQEYWGETDSPDERGRRGRAYWVVVGDCPCRQSAAEERRVAAQATSTAWRKGEEGLAAQYRRSQPATGDELVLLYTTFEPLREVKKSDLPLELRTRDDRDQITSSLRVVDGAAAQFWLGPDGEPLSVIYWGLKAKEE